MGIAGLGIFLAYIFYCRAGKVPELLSSSALYRCLLNKYYVDETYDFLLVRPFTWWSKWLANVFDTGFIDRIVNGVAEHVRGSSLFWRQLQTGNVQHYVFGFLMGTLLILGYYLYR